MFASTDGVTFPWICAVINPLDSMPSALVGCELTTCYPLLWYHQGLPIQASWSQIIKDKIMLLVKATFKKRMKMSFLLI